MSANDLIWPIFIREGKNFKEPVLSMPGVYRYTLDKLENLGDAVEIMAQRHISAVVKPEHYPMVADALLTAMTEVLGADVVTDEVFSAWGEAYNFLAGILKKREKELYDACVLFPARKINFKTT